ncbi:RDD family protein [Conexibacter sp. SYSU D00693]|uniref:RDD family protein n=1 Tax=Conexibacter sp. SYSU D00693 TaxID=2812560 RepID=UPI00196B8DA9|nr:RDD family protein [Conexibacter sp. SYSU D00693]
MAEPPAGSPRPEAPLWGPPTGAGSPPAEPAWGTAPSSPPPGPRPLAGAKLASWPSRVGAAIIDALVLMPLLLGAYAALGIELDEEEASAVASSGDALLLGLWSAVLFAVYQCVLLLRWGGQTLGKRVVAIRVVRADGERLDLQTVVTRQVVMQAIPGSLFFVYSIVDGLWPLADRENRAIHDAVAKTRVLADPAR